MPRPLPPSRFRAEKSWVDIAGPALILGGLFWMLVLPSKPSSLKQDIGPIAAVLVGIGITLFSIIRNHRHRVKPGHCPACGYDLRASKKCCPECGTPIAPEPR